MVLQQILRLYYLYKLYTNFNTLPIYHYFLWLLHAWAGSLNRDATAAVTADATADSNVAKKTWIFKLFSRIT